MADNVSMIEKRVNQSSVIMTEYGYKTFSMVVKSIGYFTCRTSPTYLRTSGVMETNYRGQPKVRPEYPKPAADYIMELYRANVFSDYDTLVIGPGLEALCYIGRAMNAPVLPSQFIASAPNSHWVQQNHNKNNLYVVGYETDWPELCVWIKPLNLFELYAPMIKQAKNIILYTKNPGPQNAFGTQRGWVKDNISILSDTIGGKLNFRFRKRIINPYSSGLEKVDDKIPHWEFSMDPLQIEMMANHCKKEGKNVVVISTGDWQGFIPAKVYQRFYEKNGLQPTGVCCHDYWACHPFYEAEFLRIPLYRFQYGADLYVDAFKKFVDSIDWQAKQAEFLTWDPSLDRTMAVNTQQRFESWGFETIYKSVRPYDIWCFGWENDPDPRNPTKEWIIPRLESREKFRQFQSYLDIDDLIEIVNSVNKTDVSVC